MITKDSFADAFDVSRETMERLGIYHDQLCAWNKKINLVSPKTIDSAWSRHFADSAQLAEHVTDQSAYVIDIGSGAGFPGLVLSITTDCSVTLVESDSRKCAFMNSVIAKTKAPAKTLNKRIESADFRQATTITSRALAPLDKLLGFAAQGKDVKNCLFLKGKSVEQEISDAQANWDFDFEMIESKTEAGSYILKIGAFDRVSQR